MAATHETFRLTSECAVLVAAESTAGPITFATMAVEGQAEFVIFDGLAGAVPTSAHMRIPVTALESGNKIYDNELRRRLNYKRFPHITVKMLSARSEGGGRFAVDGDLTIHGSTRCLTGVLDLSMPDEDTMVATGWQDVNMRDFDIAMPQVLAFKIHPDVRVQFRLTAFRVVQTVRSGRR